MVDRDVGVGHESQLALAVDPGLRLLGWTLPRSEAMRRWARPAPTGPATDTGRSVGPRRPTGGRADGSGEGVCAESLNWSAARGRSAIWRWDGCWPQASCGIAMRSDTPGDKASGFDSESAEARSGGGLPPGAAHHPRPAEFPGPRVPRSPRRPGMDE